MMLIVEKTNLKRKQLVKIKMVDTFDPKKLSSSPMVENI